MVNKSNPAAMAYFKPITEILLSFKKENKNSSMAVKVQELIDQIVSTLTSSLNSRKHIPLQAEVLKPVYKSFVWVVESL